MAKFARGVAASTVTVLLPALVIVVKLKVELGAWLLDQFKGVAQSPLALLVQLSAVAASAFAAVQETIENQTRVNRRDRVQRFIMILII